MMKDFFRIAVATEELLELLDLSDSLKNFTKGARGPLLEARDGYAF
jgi:hypothetical protein